MNHDAVAEVRLADYRPCPFAIDDIELSFRLDPAATRVHARYAIRRIASEPCPLVLDGGAGLVLESIALDGAPLGSGAYRQEPGRLIVDAPPAAFTLELDTLISPEANTGLEGLYVSGGRFCTQCETEGFRNIAFALDRPDVLSRFVVRMEADRERYPTLLSNGERIESGLSEGGRHFAVYRDPYPKPCYLFALVAGAFDALSGEFVTMSGKRVALTIHTDEGDAQRAAYAMDSLKRAMAWDERVYGREYDLPEFHIVAVRDFNFGAMENKGLNIFNSARLLADFETATDADFESVEGVVAHEYLHNWTGDRITLRDWFQLSLKEGLTIYRDEEFSADQRSRPVNRIKNVQSLWERQFAEDAGPLAHAVRPERYVEISNFYTATVYQKGGELVRVLRSLIGSPAFFRGMDLYFRRWDGHAVTLEDFVGCFEDETGRDLRSFFRWYTQAGTPRVVLRGEYDAATRSYRLAVSQTTPPTPGEAEKAALPIPLKVGFLRHDGAELSARLAGEAAPRREFDLVFDAESATFVFEDVESAPIPAVLRGYCAPVSLDDGLSHSERLVQMAHDPDPFTRWEAGQRLLADAILSEARGAPETGPAVDRIAAALLQELDRANLDAAFMALALRVPSLAKLIQDAVVPDMEALFQARNRVRRRVASALEARLHPLAERVGGETVSAHPEQVGRRALKNAALGLLASLGPAQAGVVVTAFHQARTMTERMGALEALGLIGGDCFDQALAAFLDRWRHQPLVVDKWFSVQAEAPRDDAAARVRSLAAHELFSLRNPNRVRSLFDAFGARNLRAFHAADGSGYALLGEAIQSADPINPTVAARLAKAFESWWRFDAGRQAKARAALEEMAGAPLSKNVLDVVQRTLIR